ncbi:hypothetical protein, partial [Escherichia coli]|uniref:hypothetical protein n=1 Tax=Escherichia coli TaxID=562 RepID=UPI001BC8467A
RSPCQHGTISRYRTAKLKITFCYAIKYAIQQPRIFLKLFDSISIFLFLASKKHYQVVVLLFIFT